MMAKVILHRNLFAGDGNPKDYFVDINADGLSDHVVYSDGFVNGQHGARKISTSLANGLGQFIYSGEVFFERNNPHLYSAIFGISFKDVNNDN